MKVSDGDESSHYGPSLMLGGPKSAWELVKPMMEKISTQVDDGPCVTYIGPEGSGNYVKMVHNGIDMQLVDEANDLLRNVAGLSMEKISDVFEQWNAAELQSFLIEITAKILRQKDDVVNDRSYLVNKLLNQTGSKGTGMWTMQEAPARGVPSPPLGQLWKPDSFSL
ncbi:6-phosphogluconate dehydrogenase decarboxylating [Gracilaria domingensis]|nr:6-phosphogluconate dehydrogenase decarboxylating [Gracilaria domingensis]